MWSKREGGSRGTEEREGAEEEQWLMAAGERGMRVWLLEKLLWVAAFGKAAVGYRL
jgi:hypothetical protein